MEYLFGWLAIALFVGVIITGLILAWNFSLLVLYPVLNFIFFLIPPKVYTDKKKLRKELKEKEEEWEKNAWHQITAASAFLILIFVFDLWIYQQSDKSLINECIETFSK